MYYKASKVTQWERNHSLDSLFPQEFAEDYGQMHHISEYILLWAAFCLDSCAWASLLADQCQLL